MGIPEEPPDSDPSKPRGSLRLLFPVVATSVVVALMISSGIARNRARLTVNTDRQRQFVSAVRAFRDSAIAFLQSQQQADGAWSEDTFPVLATARILLNLRRSGYGRHPLYAAGIGYVERERDRDAVPENRDEIVLRWLLDGQRPRAATHEKLPAERRGEAGGFDGLMSDLLLLGALSPEEGAAAELRASLRNRLATRRVSAASWLTLGYIAWLASENESALAGSMLPRLLEGFRAEARPSGWSDLDTVSLAAYVILLGEECLAKSDPCVDGNAAIGALVARRRADGSFPSSLLIETDGTFEASVPETTAAALSALTTFERVLELRMASR
jgi:hypothetical protein